MVELLLRSDGLLQQPTVCISKCVLPRRISGTNLTLPSLHRTPANNIKIRLGDYNLRAQTEQYPHEEYSVKQKVVHESYNPATYQNDIALLELTQDVIFRY